MCTSVAFSSSCCSCVCMSFFRMSVISSMCFLGRPVFAVVFVVGCWFALKAAQGSASICQGSLLLLCALFCWRCCFVLNGVMCFCAVGVALSTLIWLISTSSPNACIAGAGGLSLAPMCQVMYCGVPRPGCIALALVQHQSESNVLTALRCVPCGSGEISNTLSVLTPMNSIPGFVSIQALDSSVALTLRPYLCFALTSASEKELVLHL